MQIHRTSRDTSPATSINGIGATEITLGSVPLLQPQPFGEIEVVFLVNQTRDVGAGSGIHPKRPIEIKMVWIKDIYRLVSKSRMIVSKTGPQFKLWPCL